MNKLPSKDERFAALVKQAQEELSSGEQITLLENAVWASWIYLIQIGLLFVNILLTLWMKKPHDHEFFGWFHLALFPAVMTSLLHTVVLIINTLMIWRHRSRKQKLLRVMLLMFGCGVWLFYLCRPDAVQLFLT